MANNIKIGLILVNVSLEGKKRINLAQDRKKLRVYLEYGNEPPYSINCGGFLCQLRSTYVSRLDYLVGHSRISPSHDPRNRRRPGSNIYI
jgi:hypothetical protein